MMKNSKYWSSSSSSSDRCNSSRSGNVAPPSTDDEFRPLFAAFDKDNNGYIDEVELKTTMAAVGLELSDSDVEQMMKAAGVSRGERIFYEGDQRTICTHVGHIRTHVLVNVTMCVYCSVRYVTYTQAS